MKSSKNLSRKFKFIVSTIIIFVVASIFNSCHKEDLFEENLIVNKDKININHVSFETLNKNIPLAKKLDGISKVFDINQDSRTSYDITILTDDILETYVNSVYSYSFKIETPIDSSAFVENLVVMNNVNTTDYEFYIYRYYLVENLLNEDDAPYSLEVIPVNENQINFNSFENYIDRTAPIVLCVGWASLRDLETHWACITLGGGNSGSTGDDGDSSGSSSDSSGETSGSTSGDTSGSTGDGSTGDGSSTSGSSSSSNTGDSDNDTENPHGPHGVAGVLDGLDENQLDLIMNLQNQGLNLSTEQTNWVSEHTQQAQQILDYIIANNNSQEAIYLSQITLESLINNSNNNISSLLSYPINDEPSLGDCISTIIKKTMLVQDFSDTSFGSNIESSFFAPSNRHIFITSATTNNNAAAVTKYNRVPVQQQDLTGEVVVMVLSPNYLNNASDIAVVTTVVHELLHAYIINLYHDNLLLTTFPQYTELNTAFNDYVNDPNYPNELLINSNIKTNLDNEIHDIYVDFIDDLAENILGYAIRNGIEINNNPLSLDYAKSLLWGSLQGNNVFSQCPNPIQANLNFNNEINNYSDGSHTKSCNN